ncbi:hypothetical protein CASFOL_039103 [Castilleja foliolosa]|uniref:rRNA N-glycosylase n=1 Tax=Castilleja foliolosa TaxID=1961234 RepID=A0ABD3BHF6_9LAMI
MDVVATLRSYLQREMYPSFINEVRAALAEATLEGEGIYILSIQKSTPKYIKIRILIDRDETKGVDVILVRSNAYAITFAIMVDEEEEGKYFWFDDQALSKKVEACNGTDFERNYNQLKETAGYKHIGDVSVGRDYVVESYYKLRMYLHNWDNNNKVIATDKVRSNGARSLLTIILMVCEASRFDEIKMAILKKYDNSYSTLEED